MLTENNESQILISGSTYMEIERCRRILEYNDVYLRVRTRSGLIIEVWGSELMLSDYNTDGVAVRGNISSVELHGRE